VCLESQEGLISRGPRTRVFTGSGEQIEEKNLIEFRLIYQGKLPPSGNSNRRPAEKHEIRRYFHPQLRRLWGTQSNLRQLARDRYVRHCVTVHHMPASQVPLKDSLELYLKIVGEQWNRASYHLVPLVTREFVLRCSLDILLLRPGDNQLIFEQGDIDGQLKTLFDALRIPANREEAGSVDPHEDEDPFFCLLEDDKLISEVRVNSDELLLLPGQKDLEPNDSFVVIHVRLNHKYAGTFDRYFS
jgi:hypothetical protein